jgi:hypothetical protein
MLLLLAVSLFAEAGPVRAQATADQLNKLSLEALTAPPAGGGGGYGRRSYRPVRSYASTGRRSYGRSSRRVSDRRSRYGRGHYGGYRTAVGSRHRRAAPYAASRSYRRSYRSYSHAATSHRQRSYRQARHPQARHTQARHTQARHTQARHRQYRRRY